MKNQSAAAAGPKKSFGQHFLRSPGYLEQMTAALNPKTGETVVEIGPGHGALTEKLLQAGLTVQALELDRDMIVYLRQRFSSHPQFHLTAGDARKFDYASFGRRFKVIGNLPYNAAAPITSRLMAFAEMIPLMVLTYQREVARRIAAEPGSREYGYLTCLVRYYCHAEYLFTIPPGAFWPPPKVHSGVARLIPHHGHRAMSTADRNRLFHLIRQVFSGRRKNIANALAPLAPDHRRADLKDELSAWGIDIRRRPETFSLDEFILLEKILRLLEKSSPADRPAD